MFRYSSSWCQRLIMFVVCDTCRIFHQLFYRFVFSYPSSWGQRSTVPLGCDTPWILHKLFKGSCLSTLPLCFRGSHCSLVVTHPRFFNNFYGFEFRYTSSLCQRLTMLLGCDTPWIFHQLFMFRV